MAMAHDIHECHNHERYAPRLAIARLKSIQSAAHSCQSSNFEKLHPAHIPNSEVVRVLCVSRH